MVEQTQWVQKEQDFADGFSSVLHAEQRAKFHLMLASLSPHVPDWQEPQATEQTTSWVPPFSVGVQRPLYATETMQKQRSGSLHEKSFMDLFLADCLQPEPFVPSTEQVTLPAWVKASLPHWVLARQQTKKESTLREADLVDMLDQVHA